MHRSDAWLIQKQASKFFRKPNKTCNWWWTRVCWSLPSTRALSMYSGVRNSGVWRHAYRTTRARMAWRGPSTNVESCRRWSISYGLHRPRCPHVSCENSESSSYACDFWLTLSYPIWRDVSVCVAQNWTRPIGQSALATQWRRWTTTNKNRIVRPDFRPSCSTKYIPRDISCKWRQRWSTIRSTCREMSNRILWAAHGRELKT